MTEEQELNELLSEPRGDFDKATINFSSSPEVAPPQPSRARTDIDFSQWQVLPNGRYRPGSRTNRKLTAGSYRIEQDDFGPFLQRMEMTMDRIIELPEASHLRVLQGIRKFWGVKERYQRHGLVYKRGVLLWGPPGGGKTVTVQLLIQEIVKVHDGVVLIAGNPELTIKMLGFLRMIEPNRPLIVVLEDVDEIIMHHGEHGLLAILDGEHQTDNVVYCATTNYPNKLGARIVNRPSRFDERIKIGMPSPAARLAYLNHAATGIDAGTLSQWVEDTDGMSIAHLRELVVATLCLEQEYSEVLERLRGMAIMPKEEDGMRLKDVGLLAQRNGNKAYTGSSA